MFIINKCWITDIAYIQQAFIKYYSSIYSNSLHPLNNPSIPSLASHLSNSDTENLLSDITLQEIYEILKNMNPSKSPSPDGLTSHFFTTFWPQLGNHITLMIKKIFANGHLPHFLNETYIILIPKKEQPTQIDHFRPISLFNVIYKVISTLLVKRMRTFLLNIISPFQNAFVPSRSIQDNIILTHEMLHTMTKTKNKKGAFALKIDLTKLMTS